MLDKIIKAIVEEQIWTGNLCNAKLENEGNKKTDIEVFGWSANTKDPLYNKSITMYIK